MKLPPPPASIWAAECRRFIAAGGNTTHSFGLGRMIGRVFCLLYLCPQAVSLEDIATKLQVSKASVSIVVRQLFEFKAVRHVTFSGDRRDYYEAETDFLLILRSGIMPGFRKKLQTAGMQIERTLGVGATAGGGSAAPDEHSAKDQAEIRRRLRKAQALHRRLDQLLSSKILAKLL